MKHGKLELIWKDPASLVPYIRNAKRHPPEQIDKIAGQISAYGFDQPIVIDAHNVIIKGHGRREAALKLGLKEVPVIVSSLDEYQAMASRIGDNKVGESEFDYDLLNFDFGSLATQFDQTQVAEMSGYVPQEIEQVMNGWSPEVEAIGEIKTVEFGSRSTVKIKCEPGSTKKIKAFLADQLLPQFPDAEIN
jgi:hypothetical protein